MNYYFKTNLKGIGFDEAIQLVTEALKKEGFGVLTQIDVKATLKKKINVDFAKYQILGACNPPFAYKALQSEEFIGLMLPCNVVVKETKDSTIDVAVIDPTASMQAVENENLTAVAKLIKEKLLTVLQQIS
ncbi:MAG: DUF302 domain-containing protein [Chlorobi bacterium]|nr:DUF302 domain-containing protein [Chlorobiota bacterium]